MRGILRMVTHTFLSVITSFMGLFFLAFHFCSRKPYSRLESMERKIPDYVFMLFCMN